MSPRCKIWSILQFTHVKSEYYAIKTTNMIVFQLCGHILYSSLNDRKKTTLIIFIILWILCELNIEGA